MAGPLNISPFARGWLRRGIRAAIIVLAVIVALPYFIAPFYRAIDPVSTLMLWRSLRGERVERIWAPLDRIAPALPLAVIAAEDAKFCTHHGIDFGELRAAYAAADDLGDMRGGSTLTQQLAKNLFLWQGRSYVRKALEFPLALWIDFVLPKRRVMEIYLNVVEWGPGGEFGAEAGARRAFGRSAHDIHAHEAALLAAVLPNPHRRNAQRPGPGLRRLASIYQSRIPATAGRAGCLR